MQLKEFVLETLKQITDGVAEAGEYVVEKGATISSRALNHVAFDVAVTTTTGEKDKVGAGIFVAGFGIGTQGQVETGSQSVSRIKFSVPYTFPQSPNPKR